MLEFEVECAEQDRGEKYSSPGTPFETPDMKEIPSAEKLFSHRREHDRDCCVDGADDRALGPAGGHEFTAFDE
jgi:hypothetical protein